MHPGIKVALGFILMAAFILPSESQQLSLTFTCEGTDSTMASYSYVKEPSLQNSGYSRGFKSGSFNYLENGHIDVDEKIVYKYDNGTSERNTSISHDLEVNFNGTRGISEFYGKAFFGNNRAVSAWKKIRYENLSKYENIPLMNNKTASLGIARTAKNFTVVANVSMDSDFELGLESYELNYLAKVKDGVIETKDAAGWSNRTGMNRIDFEHDSLMSGEQLNITNVLKDSAPFPVEAGGDNWLTCCFSGTYPEIEEWSGCECATDECPCNNDTNGYWPDESIYGTLAPDMKLPNARLVRECVVDAYGNIRCTEPKYEKISCSDLNCTNFECILPGVSNRTDISDTGAGATRSEFANIPRISVAQSFTTKITGINKTEVTYNITVINAGTTRLINVSLIDTLPKRMVYDNSSYLFIGGKPELTIRGNATTGQVVEMNLDNFSLSQSKVVKLTAVYEGSEEKAPDYAKNKVVVSGKGPDGNDVNRTSSKAEEDKPLESKLEGEL